LEQLKHYSIERLTISKVNQKGKWVSSMGGFWVQKIHANGQLEGNSEKVYGLNIFVNVSSKIEHAPETEPYKRPSRKD